MTVAWSSVKVRGRLVVGDNEFEGVSAAISYELNTIPRASFTVEIGRGHNPLKPAAIHKTADKFKVQTPISFYLTLEQLAGKPQNLPEGEFRLFDGYLTGISWQRLQGQAQATLHAKNWLLDMDYSSALSDTSHPTNPSEFSYRTTHLFDGSGGGASWTPMTDKSIITPGTLASDFWKEGLYEWLYELTKQDAINNEELSFIGAVGGNETARKALKRFTTSGGRYVPLALDMHGADSDSVADSVWNDIQAQTFESFASTTLWGKLVAEWASSYMFAVVPRVEDAVVIPFAPGLRTQWQYELDSKDYIAISSTAELMRVLRGVGVFAGLKWRAGADLREPDEGGARLGIGGWYQAPGVTNGMIMFKQGPRWLTNMIATDRYSEFSCGAGINVIGTSFHPGAGGDNATVTTPAEIKKQSKQLIDAYAHSLYVYEQLRLRQIELSGKLRFDIAPGATVLIGAEDELFIEGDALGQDLVGDVMRITYLIDSENGRVSTGFNLSHVRTVTENKQDTFGLDRHPLWRNPWPGCGLLAMYD